MKKLILLFFMLFVAVSSNAQFKIDTETYERQKREAEESKRIQDSIRQVQLEEQRIKANDVRFRIHWDNWITYRQNIGVVESSYNISYYGYFMTKNVWTYPISLKLSSSKRYNESSLKDGYYDWSQHLTYLGMTGFRNIKDNFYFSIGGYVPLGWERYHLATDDPDRRKHTHFMTGLNAEERVFYMSPNNVGLIMGAGFYERVMTSKRYWFDIGFSLEVGLKF